MIRFLFKLTLALLAELLCDRLRLKKPRYRFVLKTRVFWAPLGTPNPHFRPDPLVLPEPWRGIAW